jgi:predicted nucleic acid-binding protein
MNRVFFDTNIVADLLDNSRRYHHDSLQVLEEYIQKDMRICISEDMISTLYYISKEKFAMLEFFKNVVFLDWEVLSYGKEILHHGVELSLKEEKDLEDILQCLCAKANGCSVIVTNDTDFYNCGIEIRHSYGE